MGGRATRVAGVTPAGLLRRLRPRVYEILLLADLVGITLAIRYGARLSFDPFSSLLETWRFARWVVAILGLGLLARGLVATIRGELRTFAHETGSFRSGVDLVRVVAGTVFTFFVYTWLKVTVPLLNASLWDANLAWAETALHFGVNPGTFLIGLFPSVRLWSFLDFYYWHFMTLVMAGLAWFATVPDIQERARFAAGFSLLWVVGSWMYIAWPSLGPCYVFPQDYREVLGRMPLQAEMQRLLLLNYTVVKSFRHGATGGVVNPVLGIGAMPSLHVAAHAFLALFARKRSRPLFLFFAAATVLTFYGSLVTGWHYAVDGYAGLLLAVLCWRLGEKLGAA